jgi:DNA polymerase-3 subunit epsilon
MNSFWDVPIIVVDVETTGHDAVNNRITEIACVVVRGGEIIQEFTSLVNPHQFIPMFISDMTGISNAMVFNAPEAEEVFAKVYELFTIPEAVFAAHNVQFDWKFVQETIKRCGLQPLEIPQLCTYKLAKRLLPKEMKKNVGALAQYFSIEINNRHRALGDAEATAKFMVCLLEEAEKEYELETLDELLQFQNKRLPPTKITAAIQKRVEGFLAQLPTTPGVYRMLGANGDLLYIGKAKSLKDRVRSYFQTSAQLPPKIAKMIRYVHSIEWEESGSELSALMHESKEIKRHKPPFNTASKKLRRYPFLRLTVQDEFPRLEWCDTIQSDGAEYYGPFRSNGMSREIAETIQRSFKLRLCSDTLSPNPTYKPCFYHQIRRCGAPCAAVESKNEYWKEVEKVRRFLGGFSDGIIAHLEEEMVEAAENLDFEQAIFLRNRLAELRRLFERQQQVSTSVTANNVILVLPMQEHDKTLEIFFIRRGRLHYQQEIGRKAPLIHLETLIETVYFGENKEESISLSREEVDEIQIVTSWMYRHRDQAIFIYVEQKNLNELIAELHEAVRQASMPKEENEVSIED